MKKMISIVIPCYCDGKNIEQLYRRLEKVTKELQDYDWGYIAVNDGSEDDSLKYLYRIAESDKRFKVIDLSKNFGKEVALSAGIAEASTSDAAICIDADLQHPPEIIPKLLEEWNNGSEIVATIRVETERQPLVRRIGSFAYYWLMARISGLKMVSQTTDYRLYDKKVISAFLRVTERERIFRGIMDWMGFRKTYVNFKADARIDGQPGYTYKKLLKLAINSITSFSLLPLKLSGYLGIFITSISGCAILYIMFNLIVNNHWGFTPLALIIVANTFLIGIVLIGLGLVSMYIGSIHTEVINRPLYIVRETINIDINE